ncbi:MAG: hypothetical protein K2X27_18475 [Candidatus Obscuribacterales bacterium]|nr:hypothetical protein [Candidatus Obscuribacterales bacterium]
MRSQLIVTAIGEDRPGIVARLTEVFVGSGANLEESRMAILGGEFAAIMLVGIASEAVPALEKDLAKLQSEGISIVTRSTTAHDPGCFKGYSNFEIVLKGADHEGIVHELSTCLRDQAVNIQSVDTMLVHAPVTGSPLFQMQAVIQVPPTLPSTALKKLLDKIAQQESVDIELKAIKEAAAV